MPAKITFDFSADKQIRKIQQDYIKLAPRVLRKGILQSYARGESPVKKGKWEKPYSKSYIKAIREGRIGFGKQTRPVNLHVTGKLWKSLKITRIDNGMHVVLKSEIADFHNRQGAGRSKAIRRMLPSIRGEEFSKLIEIQLDLLLRKVVKDNL